MIEKIVSPPSPSHSIRQPSAIPCMGLGLVCAAALPAMAEGGRTLVSGDSASR